MPDAPLVFTMWDRFDSQWYLQIAAHGYGFTSRRYSPEAFFPLYPLVIGVSQRLTGLPGVALGVLWSNAFFLAALVLLGRLVTLRFGGELAWRTVLYMILFPTSFYFSAVYTESLFLLAAVAAFYAAERGRWWLAGLSGMAAALTRNLGVTLFVPLAWLAWEKGKRTERDGSPMRHDLLARIAPLSLIPLGFALWTGYLWGTKGDPLRWMHVESAWGRVLAPPWTGLAIAVGRVLTPPPPPDEPFEPGTYVSAWRPQFAPLYSAIDGGTALTWLTLAALGRRAGLGWPYVLYTLTGVLIPLSAPTIRAMTPLASMTRYVVVLFPVFIVLARLAYRRPWLDTALTAAFPAVQALLFILFTTWNWIA